MAKVNISQYAKDLATTEENKKLWKQQVEQVTNMLNESGNKYLVKASGCGGGNSFCPYLAFFRLDALKKEDWPHNIDRNSIYLTFSVDLIERKIELQQVGHVWLSKKDLATEKYKYLCMKSMVNVGVDYGMCKKFRKSSYKDLETLKNKMLEYFNSVMQATEKYTGGYPYKNGIEE